MHRWRPRRLQRRPQVMPLAASHAKGVRAVRDEKAVKDAASAVAADVTAVAGASGATVETVPSAVNAPRPTLKAVETAAVKVVMKAAMRAVVKAGADADGVASAATDASRAPVVRMRWPSQPAKATHQPASTPPPRRAMATSAACVRARKHARVVMAAKGVNLVSRVKAAVNAASVEAAAEVAETAHHATNRVPPQKARLPKRTPALPVMRRTRILSQRPIRASGPKVRPQPTTAPQRRKLPATTAASRVSVVSAVHATATAATGVSAQSAANPATRPPLRATQRPQTWHRPARRHLPHPRAPQLPHLQRRPVCPR